MTNKSCVYVINTRFPREKNIHRDCFGWTARSAKFIQYGCHINDSYIYFL